MATIDQGTRSRIFIAGRTLDMVMEYSDDREVILAENTFLNHLGADLEVTGTKPRMITIKGIILFLNDQDIQTLTDVLTIQQTQPIELSVPSYGEAIEGFVEKVSIQRNAEKEGHDFDLSFKEHSPIQRPEVTAVNVAQAVAASTSTGITKTHHVVAGDTYWSLAQKYLGDPRLWRKIAALNPKYAPRRIPIGVTLQIT